MPISGASASRALLYYRYGMAWRTFFTELGLEVVLDAPSDRGTLEAGDRLFVDECCLASKLFLGHVAALVDQGVDAVFVPSLMGYGRFDTFYTKFQALPDLAENPCGVRISPENKAGVRKPPGNAVGPEHPPSIIAAICGHVMIYGYVMPCGYIRFISEPTLLYQSCQVGGQ
ncbi:acyl-CoA dehydratase activase-related protein [uncultured Enorma sp.]|uniref:acyl-CoA dehydratase activase-related protein n=1 Tax=uncultured Enorma sp. TaxID=1714346 RepID=UPI0026DCA3D6|nr:acyl-CoA dehydratase activase-related protein [uncultured Enorma sp.]